MQCTKKTLKSVLQNRIVAKEALRTALVEAKGILNGRLITSNVGDIEERRQIIFCFCEQTRVMKRLMLVRERSTRQNCGDSFKRLSSSFGSALPRGISISLQRGRKGKRRERI